MSEEAAVPAVESTPPPGGSSTTAAPLLSDNDALNDALDEVHTRFVLNLPDSELQRADRILFQIEQAWWFYEDFLVDAHNNKNVAGPKNGAEEEEDHGGVVSSQSMLPTFEFKKFAQQLFEYSPLLDPSQFATMWSHFTAYKKKIGTYGCILLSRDNKKVVLVQLWNSKTHTFPAGKINQCESAGEAAARETYEETGFDVYCRQGVTAEWKVSHPDRITWSQQLDETAALSFQEESGKRRTCFVVSGVPDNFPFQAVARKEISGIAWHPLDNIPRPSFAVVPFLSQLKRWIRTTTGVQPSHPPRSNTKKGAKKDSTPKRDRSNPKSEQQAPRSSSRRKGTPGRSRSNSKVVEADDDVVASGLATEGEMSGWSEADMFATNEKLLGRKVTYDGNPHIFAEGFAGQDPHAFHVVGGTFLNSGSEGGIAKLAPAPSKSRLQPLFRSGSLDEDDEKELTPFFSTEGATPWGDVADHAREMSPHPPSATRQSSHHHSSRKGPANKSLNSREDTANDPPELELLTDAQITAKSQAVKSGTPTTTTFLERCEAQYEADMQYISLWVARLPPPQPSKHFAAFRLDSDVIIAQLEPIFAGKGKNV